MLTFEDFKKVELKTAKILEAEDHPKADKLVILKIEVGEEKKQIVAGIKGKYSTEELIGKNIIVVNNLEPAIIRGVESDAMLLAAKSGEILTLIVPEKEIKSGSSVT